MEGERVRGRERGGREIETERHREILRLRLQFAVYFQKEASGVGQEAHPAGKNQVALFRQ